MNPLPPSVVPAKPGIAKPETGSRLDGLASLPFTAGLLALLAFLLAWTVLKNVGVSPGEKAALLGRLVPGAEKDFHPEPLERWLFVLLTLSAPFCTVAGLAIARRLRRWAVSFHPILPGLLVCAVSFQLLRGRSLLMFSYFPASPWMELALLAIACGLLYRFGKNPSAPQPHKGGYWGAAALIAVALWVTLLPRGQSLHSIESLKDQRWTVHFQAVSYALTQVYAGKPLLTAAPPLYGNYAEMLLPVFRLTGLSVFKFCLVMATLQALALGTILAVGWRCIRHPLPRLLCAGALLYTVGGTWTFGRLPFDAYFQYWPVRFLFPALSIPLFLWANRQTGAMRWGVSGLFAGLALGWNLDSGIAVTGALLFTPVAEAFGLWVSENSRQFRAASREKLLRAAFGALAAAAVFGGFQLFLHWQAGWAKPMHTTTEYQSLFYRLGLTMMPLPMEWHPWWLVALLYLLGLATGAAAFLAGKPGNFPRLATYLGILGLGLFTYYQGRSHDYNLLSVAWPAILLAFLFADRLLRAVGARLLPPEFRWAALPAVYFGAMATVMLAVASLPLTRFGLAQWSKALEEQPRGSMAEPVAFIRRHVGSDSQCVILARLQAVYFAETGLRSEIDFPGITELFFHSDLKALRVSLLEHPVRHLFADESTLRRLDLQSLGNAYRVVARSQGNLLYLEPVSR